MYKIYNNNLFTFYIYNYIKIHVFSIYNIKPSNAMPIELFGVIGFAMV